jgi:sugar phosphate isomerase/epimerase
MKIGCNTVAFRNFPLDFALEKIVSAGYEWVEVEANMSWCPHANPWEDDPIKFKKKIAGYGLKGVSGIGCHRELITLDEGEEDLVRALEWCHEASVPVVSTGEGRMPPEMQVDEALKILKGRLERLSEVAEKNQVVLAMEDHGSISLTPDGLPKILSLVDSPWIGANFDTANIHRGDYVGTTKAGFEWKLGATTSYDEKELLNKVVKKVRHTHIKDVVWRDAVSLGKGEVDVAGCLRILQEDGYTGVLSYETEGMQTPEESYDMIVASQRYMTETLSAL